MSEGKLMESLGTVNVTEWVEDRRRTERIAVSMPVRVCSLDGVIDKFEEISTTLNASRDGLYFASKARSYSVGMSLTVTFPYSRAAERNVHFLGKVVRVDTLSDGSLGVGIELVMTIANKEKRRPVSI